MSKSFDGGRVLPRIGGVVGAIEFIEDDPVIMCPWHQFEFSLDSGVCLTDASLRIARYASSVSDDGSIFVEIPALPSEKPMESPLKQKSGRTHASTAA